MGKLSQLSINTVPVLTDEVVSVQSPGGTPKDVDVSIANLLALLAGAGTELSALLQSASAGSGAGAYSYQYIDLGGIKFLFGLLQVIGSTSPTGYTVTFPTSFFTVAPVVLATVGPNNTTNDQTANLGGGSNPTTTGVTINVWASGTTSQEPVQLFAIGT